MNVEGLHGQHCPGDHGPVKVMRRRLDYLEFELGKLSIKFDEAQKFSDKWIKGLTMATATLALLMFLKK